MAGWARISGQRAGINALFDEYASRFSEGDLNFRQEIEKRRTELNNRFDSMEKTLRSRLELYRDATPPGIGPRLLDALDCVEKLASDISYKSPHGQVTLDYPRVTTRLAWTMTRSSDGAIAMECRDAKSLPDARQTIEAFLSTRSGNLSARWTANGFTIPADSAEAFLLAFTYPNIKAEKLRMHGRR